VWALEIAELGALIHQSALGTVSWLDSLDAIASYTNSARGQLIGLTTPRVDFNWVTGFSAEWLAEFERIDGGDPTLNFRVAAGIRANPEQLVHEAQYDAAKRGLRDDLYLDFCQDLEIPFGCQTIVAQGQAGFVGFAVLRTNGDGKTTAEDRDAFARIAPVVRDAVALQWALEGRGRDLLLGSFDAIEKAVLFLDAGGRSLAQTVAADRLLSEVSTLHLRNRHLFCDHQQDQSMLERAIGAVLSGAQGEATVVLRQPSAMPLFATVHAFTPSEANMAFRPRAIVILRSATHGGANSHAWLRHAGLTPAEIEIARALADGTPRDLIAERRGARIGTVRQQIKTIFGKLGVRREAEFIALMGRSRQF
jgi:DNA-binding CsgD family transcriptional regulator